MSLAWCGWALCFINECSHWIYENGVPSTWSILIFLHDGLDIRSSFIISNETCFHGIMFHVPVTRCSMCCVFCIVIWIVLVDWLQSETSSPTPHSPQHEEKDINDKSDNRVLSPPPSSLRQSLSNAAKVTITSINYIFIHLNLRFSMMMKYAIYIS